VQKAVGLAPTKIKTANFVDGITLEMEFFAGGQYSRSFLKVGGFFDENRSQLSIEAGRMDENDIGIRKIYAVEIFINETYLALLVFGRQLRHHFFYEFPFYFFSSLMQVFQDLNAVGFSQGIEHGGGNDGFACA
jgi:hypothetical protein